MKFRHLLFALLALLMIAFMQPLITFLGGLTLLLGIGALIFRDLPPNAQDALEQRVLGWLRRARVGAAIDSTTPIPPIRPQLPTTAKPAALSGERPRRGRTRSGAADTGGDAGKLPQ
ncbi:MAG: hypothetical protein WAT67_13205 [Candidatus Contendobacter sp.]